MEFSWVVVQWAFHRLCFLFDFCSVFSNFLGKKIQNTKHTTYKNNFKCSLLTAIIFRSNHGSHRKIEKKNIIKNQIHNNILCKFKKLLSSMLSSIQNINNGYSNLPWLTVLTIYTVIYRHYKHTQKKECKKIAPVINETCFFLYSHFY